MPPQPAPEANRTSVAGALLAWMRSHQTLSSMLFLLLVTVAMFGDVLFTSAPIVLSNPGGDLPNQYVHWRQFGFGELRHGNFPLWNPHLFSGMPFFGGFQSALLYPPNFLFLILPIHKAINFSIALHVFMGGAFMWFWTTRRGLHPLACLFSSVLWMFCGAHFFHIYAGHLSNLCAMVWAPLLLLAIDGLFEAPSRPWCLIGMFAFAMQVLAGHPQYVFYTGIAAGIYCILRTLNTGIRWGTVAGLIALVLGGLALSAVQWLTGFQEAGESLRHNVTYEFASVFSFPPENFITLLAPMFFGNVEGTYWGRAYPWEMTGFVGVTGFILAGYGLFAVDRQNRRICGLMILILLVLAMGAYTPLFKLLYNVVPGFNKFRGSSKFIFLASIFICLLAGAGVDRLFRIQKPPLSLIYVAIGVATVLLGMAIWINPSDATMQTSGVWKSWLAAMARTDEAWVTPPEDYSSFQFQFQTADHAAGSLFLSAGTLIFLVFLLLAARMHKRFVYGIVVLGLIEIFIFARTTLDTFNISSAYARAEMAKILQASPGDYRILINSDKHATAMTLPAHEIWGYDPSILSRYAEFIAATQDVPTERTTRYMDLSQLGKWMGMLRGRFAFSAGEAGQINVAENTNNILPHALLLTKYRIIKSPEAILSIVASEEFNPEQEVILETEPPIPIKESADPGYITLTSASTDRLTFMGDLSSPAILLITDAYAKGWRALPLPGSEQKKYEVMPANHCLRAVPLEAGRHVFIVEYRPVAFVIGKWISFVSAGLWLVLGYGSRKNRTSNHVAI